MPNYKSEMGPDLVLECRELDFLCISLRGLPLSTKKAVKSLLLSLAG